MLDEQKTGKADDFRVDELKVSHHSDKNINIRTSSSQSNNHQQ